jgi:hypothetical protein
MIFTRVRSLRENPRRNRRNFSSSMSIVDCWTGLFDTCRVDGASMRMAARNSQAKSRKAKLHASSRTQIDMFEFLGAAHNRVSEPACLTPPMAPSPKPSLPSQNVVPNRAARVGIARRITVEDLPAYDHDSMAIVDASLAEAPASKLWYTYQDIQRYFGVSRATVARKLKAGLVPDILFEGDRVVEEGAVRRFSRNQVRFVLLAVRRRDWRLSAS